MEVLITLIVAILACAASYSWYVIENGLQSKRLFASQITFSLVVLASVISVVVTTCAYTTEFIVQLI